MSLNFKEAYLGLQRFLTLERSAQAIQSQETLDSDTRIHHYTRENEHEKSRIHLRIDPDGTGTLIVNANSVMHLNPTAALMAHLLLEEKSEQEIVASITRQYRVKLGQAQ